jgi:curved DNA-binding protein
MKFKDYYQILGVERGASEADIKKAYRKLAHQYHPDVTSDPEGEAKFKEIAEAYATLKDPDKRAEYDSLGRHRPGETFTPPPDWQQQFGAGAGDNTYFDDVDLADILSAFGRQGRGGGFGGRAQAMAMPGEDIEARLPVTLEQIMRGGEIEVQLALPEVDAHGLIHRTPRTFRVNLPRGAAHGQRLRLAGKGGPGFNGGAPGDLYLALSVAPHPRYRVDGRNLSMDLPLAPWEAVLGASVQLPTLNGTVELKVPPGTTAGRKFRLSGQGLPTASGGNGDLYAVATIDVPKSPSAREQELLKELAQASHFNPRAHLQEGTTT